MIRVPRLAGISIAMKTRQCWWVGAWRSNRLVTEGTEGMSVSVARCAGQLKEGGDGAQLKCWAIHKRPLCGRNCRASHLPPATLFHAYGVRMSISVVAFSIAALVNGNARGVTLRQSSSWSFQCALFGQPDSPNVMPVCFASRLLGSAIRP